MDSITHYIESKHKKETFVEMLCRLIDSNGLTDAEVYHRARLDRRFFSKMRSDIFYKPKKKNVIALALALHLENEVAKQLIKKAGYILTSASKFDLIIRYCFENHIYEIQLVNELLYETLKETL